MVGVVCIAVIGVVSSNEVEGEAHEEIAAGHGETIVGTVGIGVVAILDAVAEANASWDDEDRVVLFFGCWAHQWSSLAGSAVAVLAEPALGRVRVLVPCPYWHSGHVDQVSGR